MRADVLKLYKTVHSWTGIVSGMLLFVCFYAGALTIFAEPLGRWATPPAQGAATEAGADALIAATLAARPDAAKDFTLRLAADGRPARLSWRKSRDDAVMWSAAFDESGELRVERSHPSSIAAVVDRVHRTAGLPVGDEIGEKITGVLSALYFVALASGLILVMPSLVRDFLALRLSANLKRMWLDAHNLVGVASLPFHLVIALTAFVFGLHDPIYAALDRLVYDGKLPAIMRSTGPFAAVKHDDAPATTRPAAELIAAVATASPGFAPTSLHYRDIGTRGALVRVSGEDPRFLSRGGGFAALSGATAKVVNMDYLPEAQTSWTKLVSAFFALHFGSYGGETVRWAYFFLGLAGAFLFYSGNLLWIESRRRTARRHGEGVAQTRSTRLMAAASVGVCLGCVCGLSIAMAAVKWLPGHVTDIEAASESLYHAVAVSALAYAFARGAAHAGAELLLAASVTTAALPATSLLAVAAPGLGPWASADPSSLCVDLVALCAALGFAVMARATRRRIEAGPPDSVWSARLPIRGETAKDSARPRDFADAERGGAAKT
jgi:uncharacterized iron-regulated membrane protein